MNDCIIYKLKHVINIIPRYKFVIIVFVAKLGRFYENVTLRKLCVFCTSLNRYKQEKQWSQLQKVANVKRIKNNGVSWIGSLLQWLRSKIVKRQTVVRRYSWYTCR